MKSCQENVVLWKMKPPVSLLKVLVPHEQKIELALVAAILLCGGINYFGIVGGQEALMVTTILLSGFYFLSAYFPAAAPCC